MFSVRSLVGATFALAISAFSANAIPVAPGSNTPITAPNTYAGQNTFGAGLTVLDTYTFTFAPSIFGVSTSITLDGNGAATGYGIANLYYQWVGISPIVQVSDALGNAIDTPSSTGSLITGILASSPLQIIVFTDNGGKTLALGGQYQMRLTVSQCDGPNCAPPEVPIPGAVVLFGSVLAGGVGGMQIMRRRRKALAA